MRISYDMDLKQLLALMGEILDADTDPQTVAEDMRKWLVIKFEGEDTSDVPPAIWLEMQENAYAFAYAMRGLK